MNYYTILNAASRLALSCGYAIKSQQPAAGASVAPIRKYYLVNTDNQVIPIRLGSEIHVFTLQELLTWFSLHEAAEVAAAAKTLLADLLSEQYQQVIEVKCRPVANMQSSRAY